MSTDKKRPVKEYAGTTGRMSDQTATVEYLGRVGYQNGKPPPGFKDMNTRDLTDDNIRQIKMGDTNVAEAWATMRVGIRKLANEKERANRDRAEFQVLLDILKAMGLGVAISEEPENG